MTPEQLQSLIDTLKRHRTSAQRQAEQATDAEQRGFYRGQASAYTEALMLIELASGARPTPATAPTLQAGLLSVREAARFTGLGERTIRQYIKDGRLPTVRLGVKKVRIRHADLEALIRR